MPFPHNSRLVRGNATSPHGNNVDLTKTYCQRHQLGLSTLHRKYCLRVRHWRIGFSLEPIVGHLVLILRQRAMLHADETPVQQLDQKAKLGGTKKAYLWAYRSNSLDGKDPIVMFDYQTSRAGHHVREFLQHWQGG